MNYKICRFKDTDFNSILIRHNEYILAIDYTKNQENALNNLLEKINYLK